MAKLVGPGEQVKVVIQPKNAQRPHEHAQSDGEVTALEAVERRSRHADSLRHLGRGNPTPLPSKAQALAKPLRLPQIARVRGDGLLAHVQ